MDPRRSLCDGCLGKVVSAAIALWKRERSSSSSSMEMEIWRGGRILGANMRRIETEMRRVREGISTDNLNIFGV